MTRPPVSRLARVSVVLDVILGIGALADGLVLIVAPRGEVMPLPVGGAFHTPLLAPAVEAWRPVLDATTFTAPSAPLVDNTDAVVRPGGDAWASLLASHLVEPVRWRESQLALASALGVTDVVELAPAGTLTAMAKRTVPDLAIRSLDQLLDRVVAQ